MRYASIGNFVRFLGLTSFVVLPAVVLADDPDLIVADQVLVRLLPGTNIAAFISRHPEFDVSGGGAVMRTIPAVDTYQLKLLPDVNEDDFADYLAGGGDADVVWAETNYDASIAEGSGRNFFFRTGNSGAYHAQPSWTQIGLSSALQYSRGAGATVAVIDSGVDATHPELAARILPGWNFFDQTDDTSEVGDGLDNDGDTYVDEMVGHGTHVAGIVAAVAPDAMILPVKIFSSDGDSDNFIAAQAINYAIDNGAQVINCSFGSTYDSDPVEEAVERATAAGVVVIGAAGNLDRSLPEYPALTEEAIGVTAVDNADRRCSFSNYNIDLAASAPGWRVCSTLPPTPEGAYGYWDGTSMAAPMVSGAAALLISQHPEWPANHIRAELVRAWLTGTAANIDALNPAYAGTLGAGRLDAAAALATDCVVAPCRGDANCDGSINQFDIQAFTVAISDPAQYLIQYPGCQRLSSDCNYDGSMNSFDIQVFLDLLSR